MVKKDRIMKKNMIFSLMAVLAVYGCQVEEIVSDINTPEPLPEGKIFTAIIDDDTSTPTSTHLDDGNVLWNQNDQVSVFDGTTENLHYKVTDESVGQKEATLEPVSAGSGTGTAISNNVAYYPYASGASIEAGDGSYIISGIELPATQTYVAGSFGNGAFPMAAINAVEDIDFKFKNLFGGLKLQLTGTATITSISVRGNNNETLCGAATVTVPTNGSMPSIELTGTDASAKTVTLNCGAGVTLNTTTPTPFIIALPPVTFTKGFFVTVTDSNGKKMNISTAKSKEMVRSSLRKMPSVEFVDYEDEPFTITSTGSTTVSIIKVGNPSDISLEYSLGDDNWSAYTIGTSVSLSNGESVQFRAGEEGNSTFSQSDSKYYKIVVSGTGTIMASGNVMSLLDQSMITDVPENSFFYLFRSCAKLTDASNLKLPATTAEGCYYYMFSGCTSLTQAPALPATTLAEDCYCCMFFECTSLTQAPALPATTLANCCYSSMFQDCTSLTQAPALPATTLADDCYNGMFQGCTSLTQAPALPATTLADYCYEGMFKGCISLIATPVLPAPLLLDCCYRWMFEDCTSLNAVTCLATYIPWGESECTSNWLSGVAATGTFTKAEGMTGWRLNSDSGIPDGWTVKDMDYSAEPFTITSIGSTEVSIRKEGTPNDISLQYRKGADNWAAYTIGDGVSLSDGQSVQFRAGEGGNSTFSKGPPTTTSTTITNYYKINVTDTGTVIASGNIMSLLDSSLESTLPAYSFYYLFYNCEKLTDASNLKLPAETLANYCYKGMFSGCTSLTTAPELPATKLAQYCYQSMFQGCTALTTAPEIPATTVMSGCCQSMFQGCTSLTTAPTLPSITQINNARNCYNSMFKGCTGLTTAPALPTTNLKNSTGCYQSMFQNCSSRTTAPELPATTLAESCYRYMFQGCTSLTTAPALKAYTQKQCYYQMFKDCSSLNAITCLATIMNGTDCTTNWLSGVAATGTFTKAASMTDWTLDSPSGIPSGWTVVDYSE